MTSIIILVQNRYEYFSRCIESILKWTHSPFEFIFIVQGHVDDQIIEIIRSLDVPYTLIHNEVNNGVTPGRNQGIGAANGEYILFFDDDAYIDENYDAMSEFYKLQRDLDWLDRLRLNFSDPSVGVVAQSGYYINPRYSGMFYDLPDTERHSCDVGQGYCFMFRRSVVDKIGGLDPFFGKFWHEESEYALRAKFNGFKVIKAGYIGVMHIGSGSGDDGTFSTKADYMFNKWQPHFSQILEFPTKEQWTTVPPQGFGEWLSSTK